MLECAQSRGRQRRKQAPWNGTSEILVSDKPRTSVVNIHVVKDLTRATRLEKKLNSYVASQISIAVQPTQIDRWNNHHHWFMGGDY